MHITISSIRIEILNTVNAMKFSLHSIYDYYRSLIRSTKYRWWIVLGTLIYFISPLDFSPDFFPIIGQIDDFVILSLLITELIKVIFEERRGSTQVMEKESSENETVEVEVISIDKHSN
ncbi:hypothetical protein CPARK_000114200 [cyanobacterium endosymbiont of Braarudosphaera bigelowii]|uniref:DUF1232 domain-containing protein n=2 Tax=Candidatus Atelocyanobacterium thalassae TaxID=713887 RepID=A0ABM7U689_9CHRO|nr:hypothetical protein CPARK_000114200 [cyanobacterium endosymbiont of Braarudosphaera bigelowii]